VDAGNAEMSIFAFVRKSVDSPPILVVCNFTPVPRRNYLLGIPQRGVWKEILNSDAVVYGGSGWGNMGSVESSPVSAQGRSDSINLSLPPLSVIMLRWEGHG
jgi:1,4-alpha-glucan branching enzyme